MVRHGSVRQKERTTCGMCRHGRWVLDKTEQRDTHGRPILIRCQFAKYSVTRGMLSCERYEFGNKET